MWENFMKSMQRAYVADYFLDDRAKFFNVMQKVVATTKVPRVPLRLVDPSTQRLIKQSPYDITGNAQKLNHLCTFRYHNIRSVFK